MNRFGFAASCGTCKWLYPRFVNQSFCYNIQNNSKRPCKTGENIKRNINSRIIREDNQGIRIIVGKLRCFFSED